MKEITISCQELTTIFENYASNFKKKLMLLLFVAFATTSAFAQNSCAISGVGDSVIINDLPVFPVPAIASCADNPDLTFQSNPLVPSTYLWSFFSNSSGASIIGSATGRTVQVNSGPNNGSFFLICTVTSIEGGFTENCGHSVAVLKPTVTADDKSICAGSTVALTGTPEGGVWSGDHVTGSTFDGAGLPAGPYNVTYTFTTSVFNPLSEITVSCSNFANATVTVIADPVIYTLTGGSYCAGDTGGVTVSLSDSETGVNYQLKKGGVDEGAPVAGTGNQIDWINKLAGSYTVVATLVASPFCTSTTDPATVTEVPNPIIYTLTGGSYCAGDTGGVTVSLSDSETGVNYQLKKGGVDEGAPVAGTGNQIDWINKLAGSYTVVATLVASPFCTSTTDPATVTEVPNPIIYTLTGGSYCAGDTGGVTVSLSDSETGVNYQLKKGGVDEGAPVAGTGNQIDWINKLAGSYTVVATLVASPFCTSTTDPAIVTTEICAQEGCTLGYWKNHTDRWCQDYRTCDLFGNVFVDAPSNLANLTLLEALNLGGGGIYNLARQGVAALLNTCSDEVDYAGYFDNSSSVIDAVNAAYRADGKAPGLLASELDYFNNSGCPLGGTRANKATNCIDSAPTTNTSTEIETIKTELAGFKASPVPFKNQLTIRYDFDYQSDVTIEVFNAQGVLVFSKLDTNSYLNKEVMLNIKVNKDQDQLYIVKLTTNQGSSTRKVMSSR
jgi:hypothetical protein